MAKRAIYKGCVAIAVAAFFSAGGPLPLFAAANRQYFAGGGADLVMPYFWFTDSVYTYDSTVDWYRAVRYDFGVQAGGSLQAGFDDALSKHYRWGVEAAYSFVPPASRTVNTAQQVGAVAVQIQETATLTHHVPRLSLRLTQELAERWNLTYRLGVADHIVSRTIDPRPQNLPAGVNLSPSNAPARADTYAVLTADIAAGLEYVADNKHGIAVFLSLNPPMVYPETLRNHIVLPYFAQLSLQYRYIW